MGKANTPPDLLPGTLDLLVLHAVAAGPLHGYGIVQRIRAASAEVQAIHRVLETA